MSKVAIDCKGKCVDVSLDENCMELESYPYIFKGNSALIHDPEARYDNCLIGLKRDGDKISILMYRPFYWRKGGYDKFELKLNFDQTMKLVKLLNTETNYQENGECHWDHVSKYDRHELELGEYKITLLADFYHTSFIIKHIDDFYHYLFRARDIYTRKVIDSLLNLFEDTKEEM